MLTSVWQLQPKTRTNFDKNHFREWSGCCLPNENGSDQVSIVSWTIHCFHACLWCDKLSPSKRAFQRRSLAPLSCWFASWDEHFAGCSWLEHRGRANMKHLSSSKICLTLSAIEFGSFWKDLQVVLPLEKEQEKALKNASHNVNMELSQGCVDCSATWISCKQTQFVFHLLVVGTDMCAFATICIL